MTMNAWDSVMIRGQQSFEKYNQLNLIKIKKDNHVIHVLKNAKNAIYYFISIGLLLSSGMKNDADRIFIVSEGLNNAKHFSVNGKNI